VIGKETRSEFGPRELVYCSDGSCVRSTVWLDAMVYNTNLASTKNAWWRADFV
jgi:hypothetical protein